MTRQKCALRGSASVKVLAALLGATPIALFAVPACAGSLPTNGKYVSGSGAIQKSTGGMTINQSSTTGIIDWHSFSIGAGKTVQFDNGSGATLNEVTGNNLSAIAGSLRGTGSVYLVNPSGVVVTSTGRVLTQGNFGATTGSATGNISNAGSIESAHGDVTLGGNNITNSGAIVSAQGGHIWLNASGTADLGGSISAANANGAGGSIVATGKTVNVGSSARLNASGKTGGTILIGGEVHGGATAADNFVSQNVATAETTNVAKGATISANGSAGKGGNIVVWSNGYTQFEGAIEAKGANGTSGGFAEVSSHGVLGFGGHVDLTSFHGTTGTLLLDPENVTISNAASTTDTCSAGTCTPTGDNSILNVTTLENALATSNVLVTTGATGSQTGDITVLAPITWSANTLTLNAYHSINIDAPLTIASGGGLALITDNGGSGGSYNFDLGPAGFAGSVSFTGPPGSGQSLSINNKIYTLLYSMSDVVGIENNLSGNYALANPINASGTAYTTGVIPSLFTGTFTGLGNTISNLTIDAPGTQLVGLFAQTSGAQILDVGLVGASVTGLADVGGLVGSQSGGSVANAFAMGSVTSNLGPASSSFNVGGLVGTSSGAIINSFASVAISTTYSSNVGGLVGTSNGSVIGSFATGSIAGGIANDANAFGGLVGQSAAGSSLSGDYAAVSIRGGGSYVGGLVGQLSGLLTDSYATGSVEGQIDVGGLVGDNNDSTIMDSNSTGAVTGGFGSSLIGGLVGYVAPGSTIKDSYSTGFVSGGSQSSYLGGLIGGTGSGAAIFIVNDYFDTTTSGQSYGVGEIGVGGSAGNDGSVGWTTTQLQNSLPTGFADGAWATGAGLYPYLVSFFPHGAQSISGFAYNSSSSALAAAQIAVYQNGVLLTGGSASTGANGYYYEVVSAGSLSGTSKLGLTITTPNAPSESGLTFTDQPALVSGNLQNFDATSGTFFETTAEAILTGLTADLSTAFGSTNFSAISAQLSALPPSIRATNPGGFNFDQGDVPLSLTGLTIDATQGILFTAPVDITGAGKVVLTTNDGGSGGLLAFGLTSNGFVGSLSFTAALGSGQSLTINGQPYTLITAGQLGRIGSSVGYLSPSGDYAIAQSSIGATALSAATFTGILNGLGHTISGFDAELILQTSNATISSIGLSGSLVSGGNYLGTLIGTAQGGSIFNVYASGEVNGTGSGIGGLIGLMENASLFDAFAEVTVLAASGASQIGGLVGSADGGAISDSFATGAVGCCTSGTIANISSVGGLVGQVNNAALSNDFATGSVTGNTAVGGLVGWFYNQFPVGSQELYATGAVRGNSEIGGLTGYYHGGSIYAGYYDSNTTGQPTGVQNDGSTGVPTSELQGTLPVGFSSVFWSTGAGQYPFLNIFFPYGHQLISGYAYSSSGIAAPNAQVTIYEAGSVISGGVVLSGANGYFYDLAPFNTVLSTSDVAATIVLAGSALVSGFTYRETPIVADTLVGSLSITSGLISEFTAASSQSGLTGLLQSTFGTAYSTIESQLVLPSAIITQANGGSFAINQPLALSSLTLNASSIFVDAPLTVGGLNLDATAGITFEAPVAVTGAGAVVLTTGSSGAYQFLLGPTGFLGSLSFLGTPNTGESLKINGQAYTLVYSVQQLADGVGQSGYYAIALPLNAAGVNYTPEGDYDFSGTLTGLGNTISNLTINEPPSWGAYTGLFPVLNGTLRDLGLVNVSVTGSENVGALVGYAETGSIQNVYSTGSVSSNDSEGTGGLVGKTNAVAISNSWSSASLASTNWAGGLVGILGSGSSITDSFATGSYYSNLVATHVGGLVGESLGVISNAFATGWGGSGLVGTNSNGATISYSYSTGGRLVGSNQGIITDGYYDSNTSGQPLGTQSDGSVGLSTTAFQNSLPTGFSSSVWGSSLGLYPYLGSFFPNGAQAVSGYAYTSAGAVAVGGKLGIYVDGVLLTGGTVASGANGYYYEALPAGTIGASTTMGETFALNGATLLAGINFTDEPTVGPNHIVSLNVSAGAWYEETGAPSLSALDGELPSAFGGELPSIEEQLSSAMSSPSIRATSALGFLVDQPLELTGLIIDSSEGIAFAAPVGISNGGKVDLITDDGALGGVGGGLSFAAGDGLTFASTSDSLTINGSVYTLINSMSGLQTINNNLTGDYALANSLNAASTTGWSPIGTNGMGSILNGGKGFTGTFEGLGNSISNLSVNVGANNYSGLFGYSNGTIRDVALLNVAVAGTGAGIGGLVGANESAGSLVDDYVTGSVSGNASVGGLVGINAGSITESFAAAIVTASGLNAGGLTGVNSGSITDSYAMGPVTAGGSVGGLAGYNSGEIADSYAVGLVSCCASMGGLVGTSNNGIIVDSFWDIDSSGIGAANGVGNVTNASGVSGLSTLGLQLGLPGTFSSTIWAEVPGVSYPYLRWEFPVNAPQVISGQLLGGGQTQSQPVMALDNGTALDPVLSMSSSADGYFYLLLPAGTIADGSQVLAYASGPSGGAVFSDNASGSIANLDIVPDYLQEYTSDSVYSGLLSDLSTAIGNNAALQNFIAALPDMAIVTSAPVFTIDRAVSAQTLVLISSGSVTQSAPLSVTSLDLLGASASYTLTNASNVVADLAADASTVNLNDGATALTIGIAGGTSGITAATLTLTDTGTVTQSQAIMATNLELLGSGGSYTLTSVPNNIGTLAANTGTVNLTDGAHLLSIGTAGGTSGVNARTLTLNDTGSVTQSQAITATGLELLGTGGTYMLTDSANNIGTLAANAGTVSLNDGGNALSIGTAGGTSGVNVTTLTLNDTGNVTQSQAITANNLELLGAGGSYLLTNGGNETGTLAGNTGMVNLADDASLTIGTAGGTTGLAASGGATLAMLGAGDNLAIDAALTASGSTIDLISAGTIGSNSSGIVTAATLTGSSGGATTLKAGNHIANLGTFGSGVVLSLTDAASLTVTGAVDVGTGTLTLKTKGGHHNLTIDAALTGAKLDLFADGTISASSSGVLTATRLTGSSAGGVSLGADNAIATLESFTTGNGDFSLSDGRSLTIAGAVDAGTGDLSLMTLNAGNLTIDASLTGDTVNLVAAGKATEKPSGAIIANFLNVTADTGIKLTSSLNQIGSVGTDQTNSGKNKITL